MAQRIDLHSHLIPQPLLGAIEADPARFPATVEQRGERCFIVRGSHAVPLDVALCDADAGCRCGDAIGARR